MYMYVNILHKKDMYVYTNLGTFQNAVKMLPRHLHEASRMTKNIDFGSHNGESRSVCTNEITLHYIQRLVGVDICVRAYVRVSACVCACV